MIEQCLDGDTGSSKAWDTAKDFRVHEDGSGQSGIIHKLNLRLMGRRSSGVETDPQRAPTLAPTGSGQVRGRRVVFYSRKGRKGRKGISDAREAGGFEVGSLGGGGLSEAAWLGDSPYSIQRRRALFGVWVLSIRGASGAEEHYGFMHNVEMWVWKRSKWVLGLGMTFPRMWE